MDDEQPKDAVAVAEKNSQEVLGEMQEKYVLKSHFDIVRGLHFIPSMETLASISEDCLVKLWNLNDLDTKYQEQDGNLEPYITLRGHTGPLLSVTGSISENDRLLFTAGTEGCIRVWNLPAPSEVNFYGDTQEGKNYCIGTWQVGEEDVQWDIKHHPFQDLLLSVSANK